MTRIEFAPADKTDRYEAGIDRFLAIIGIRSALVTDESTVWDFLGVSDDDKRLQALGRALSRPVHLDEYVWVVAKELEATQ